MLNFTGLLRKLPMTSLRKLQTISVFGLLRKLAMTVGIHCHFWLFDFLMPIRNDVSRRSSLRACEAIQKNIINNYTLLC